MADHLPITVAEVMLISATSARRDTPVSEVLRIMRQFNLDCLVVEPLRPGQHYGIITLRDVQAKVLGPGLSPHFIQAHTVMTSSELLIAPTMRLEDCATLLVAAGTSRAVVVSNGHAVGIISASAIFQAIEARPHRTTNGSGKEYVG